MAKAEELMPGGVNSPVRAFKSVDTPAIFMDHGECSRIYDIDGNEVKLRLKGYPAIVFQHEIDHLNGIMFYDYIDKDHPLTPLPDSVEV